LKIGYFLKIGYLSKIGSLSKIVNFLKIVYFSKKALLVGYFQEMPILTMGAVIWSPRT
jgi:hypothetical protein